MWRVTQASPALARLWKRETVLRVRAGQGRADGPCGVLQLFGGDNFVLPEVGFPGCPQDTEPLSSPRHVALQLPGLTPLR